MVKILAFSGSARRDSYNQQLVKLAAKGAQEAGAKVTIINLADYPMPIFCQDIEQENGMPEHAEAFKNLLLTHHGLLIASPEYNSAYSPLLKNTLDWASRATSKDEVPLSAYKEKVACIMAASPRAMGGVRGLSSLRLLLSNMGVTVLPQQVTIERAYSSFSQGRLVEEDKSNQVMRLGRQLANILQRHLDE
ncbi:NADPH-dependent FMN reductase [Thalassotalea mangrovi]|uniref:NAD(P)H-dependent oxidoreductase n=1 Tax=Thalassotalea mangrovi TaxID=2572245 RepID=A0A4U1B7S6_9GAMM|nr:NAD(P)H-dependent oxidoreductase [Thalassotalea mangrovi]TKB46664.1 NAD(P)H-dependent oxidoreductase [Thalassotalea mangrovi]